MSVAVITAPTCRFKTKRTGPHIGIVRGDICGDCLIAMQAALSNLGDSFCFECGHKPSDGDLMGFFYRDSGAMLLCQACSVRFGAKITSEIDAEQSAKQALTINSIDACEKIYSETDLNKRMTLWQHFRDRFGPKRRM